MRLRLNQPFSRFSGLGMIEVFDRRFGEGLAERCPAFLPFLFANEGKLVDVAEVMHRELGVLSQGTGRPTVKTGHDEQHP